MPKSPVFASLVTSLSPWLMACLFAAGLSVVGREASAAVAGLAPPNAPAEVELDRAKSRLVVHYGGRVILDAKVMARTPKGVVSLKSAGIQLVDHAGREAGVPSADLIVATISGDKEKVEQRLKLSLWDGKPGTALVLRGSVSGSEEAFPAETLSPAQERFACVRNSVGLSRSLRNNAIYDRKFDWALSGPAEGATRIAPRAERRDRNEFAIETEGSEIELVFKPRFYQKHKNIRFFEPWNYKVWRGSITGWCSWWAYMSGIREQDVKDLCGVFAEKLKDYGYEYVQIDDGFQSSTGGLPKDWLNTNDKFPSGLMGLADAIRAKGLKPALWVNVHFGDKDYVAAHPDYFLRDAGGKNHEGQWIGYGLDGGNPAAIDAVVRPLYRELHKMGWRYIKIDTLRHLLYDSTYPCRDYFKGKNTEGELSYRRLLDAAREELGRDTYILACWGVLPETAGIVDGCRLGGDGFGPCTMQEYNSWNNVVWRNDPDHVDISPAGEEIIRPVLISMAGAQMLLSDKVDVYRSDTKIEGARRSSPVLFTLPGQLYDFDPRKTDNLIAGHRNENGGGAAGPIDADQFGAACPWWLLEVNRPFESWSILAHFNWQGDKPIEETQVKFADLGLPTDREYLVYEFWTKQFVGSFRDSFTAPGMGARQVRVYAIREKLDRPQVLSTSRHITQGGADLVKVAWDGATGSLSGASEVVANDGYALTLRVPGRFGLVSAEIDGKPGKVTREGEILTLATTPARTGRVSWLLRFKAE